MGSLFSVINWTAAERAGVTRNSSLESAVDSSLVVNDITGQKMDLAIGKFDLKVLGEKENSDDLTQDVQSTYEGAACIGDLPAFSALGSQDVPFMTCGMDIMSRKRLVLDFSNNIMYLSPGD